jgi:outer membrane receptor protein involved in Fe transport
MIRRILSTLTFLLFVLTVWGQTSLEGKAIDIETKEPILFGNVALYQNGNLITGTQTDLDGNYVFSNIDPGTYDVEVSYVGFQTQRQTGVLVLAGKSNRVDFELSSGVLLQEIEVKAYKAPLIEQDNTTTGGVVTAEKIRNLPTKNINALAATTAGISSIDGGAINVRGSRSDGTNYYIDGIRVSGNQVPQSEIDQMQVITGGIESRYGDVTGGVISITTKGPSQRYSGAVEVETSEFLDAYGYNLLSANLSGPILKKKNTNESIVGFRFSGQYIKRGERSPEAIGVYRATEDAIARIEADPVTDFIGSPLNSGERLEASDVELLKARPNNSSESLILTGKIDFRLNQNIDLSISGNYNTFDGTFLPSGAWGLLNWQNNPYTESTSYRLNGRFRHRLGSAVRTAETDKASLIRNASYTLQFGYEKSFGESGDKRYKDNFFQYGNIGNFDVEWVPSIGVGVDSVRGINVPGTELWLAQTGYSETYSGYSPGQYNPIQNNYNKLIESVDDFRELNAYNGFLSNTFTSLYSGLHTNVGSVYNSYSKSESDRYTFVAESSFDLFPGGSDQGRHNIQFGVQYEERLGRSWGISPRGLWTLARQQANSQHIIGLDSVNVIDTTQFDFFFQGVAGTYDVPVYANLIQEAPNLLFYRKVRELTGQPLTEYVNVDGIDPNDLSIDMFAPQELQDRRIIGYAGYDYLGNKTSSDITFDDFFTDFDEAGRRQFTIAPNRPIYAAAYIQDKFTFRDIIFRLGLRVERYDANTKVLKDPFSLYEVIQAQDFYSLDGVDGTRPANVGEDYKVYVTGENSTDVKAFRDGEQWYDGNGTPVNDGNLIFGQEIVFPYYTEQDQTKRNIRSLEFNPDGTFEDYEPQVNYTPRLAFSFPISDEANFFAHYDILVQRPPSNSFVSAASYYYFEETQPENNPNLRPERTIDYELGFKQRITNSSAITLTAYYKEMRDMIQSRQFLYLPAPIGSYSSFGNLDFGTVKGFSFSYDLRRTNNLELTASYTLQFADGTGSSATSQRALNSRGNIRSLSPLSFDERHRLVTNIDFRYASGKRYNGPRWFGADVFANSGVGMQLTAVSGRPYTSRSQPTRFGGTGIEGAINGARLPWNLTIDLRADKSFRLFGGEDKRPMFLNVYFRVQNLLDTRNVIGVYSASGSASDDGFLASPLGSANVGTLESTGRADDVDNFLLSYQWALLNPNFYTLPRRMYLGAIVEF